MPIYRNLALLGLVAWVAAARGAAPAAASSVGVTCVELRRTTADLVAVPVHLESRGISRGAYQFLLDTGSEATFVDDELAEALELAATSRTTILTANGSMQSVQSRASLTYGALQVRDLEMVRDPLTALRAAAPEIRGVLGQDVLRRTNWLLDYRMGVVIQDPDGLLGEQVRGDRLAVHWAGDRPTVQASFSRATPVRLVLDSAATGIVLFKLPVGVATGVAARMQTLGAEKSAPMLAIGTLRVGSLVLPHPLAAVMPQDVDVDEAGGLLPTSLFDALYFNQTAGSVTVVNGEQVQSTKCKVEK
jgi:predicted aspartyl protease